MRRIELSPPPCSTESIPLFEAAVAKATGTQHALATSSGTAAIHLALLALGVGPGDVVLCSTLTFCASANPIVYCGATPVFIDCDATWQIDPDLVAEYLKNNPRPKALIAVDLYGRCCDYDRLGPICAQHGVPIVEDAAESLGATYKGQPAGSFGRCGIISFNLNKIVSATGGGMLVSDDKALIERARFLATQAKDQAGWYQHSVIGYNYRMAAAVAEFGLRELGRLNEAIAGRRLVKLAYRARDMATSNDPGETCWLTVTAVPDPSKAITALAAHGIEARRSWKPLHRQPVFADARAIGGGVADTRFARGLCLPSHESLTEQDIQRICDIIKANL